MEEDVNPRPESFYFDRIERELRGLSDLHWQRSLDKRRRPEFIQWTGSIPITLTGLAVSSVFPKRYYSDLEHVYRDWDWQTIYRRALCSERTHYMAHLFKSLIVLVGITTSFLAQATPPAAPKNLRLISNLATPTLVQHVATGMDRNKLNTLNITLPNPVGAGNCLILGVQYNSASSSAVTSVNDNLGNTWAAGPKSSNASFQNQNLFYALNAKAGITSITITISKLSSQESFGSGRVFRIL